MNLSSFYTSSLGRKYIVGITGAILIGYVVGHLLGNLLVFVGPDAINAYAAKLHAFGALLWAVRLFLLVAVVLHIYFTVLLAIENRKARPDRYVKSEHVKSTVASRTMWISGLLLLAFIVYHIAHFTVRVADPRVASLKLDALGRFDVYSMMIYGFQNAFVSGFYILAMYLLALHLSHGASSFFQTLGVNDKRLAPKLAHGARIFAWLIFAGYAAIPIAVLAGVLKPAQQL